MAGINLIQSNEKHDSFDRFGAVEKKNINHTMSGAYASFYSSRASLFVEVLKKSSKETTTDYNEDGSGLYANLMMPLRDWSLLVEYKNYKFLTLAPTEKENFVNQFGYHADFSVNTNPGYRMTIINGRLMRHLIGCRALKRSQIHIMNCLLILMVIFLITNYFMK